MLIRRLSAGYFNSPSRMLMLIACTFTLLYLSGSSSAQTEVKQPVFGSQTRPESDRQILFRALEEIGNRRFQEGRALLKVLIVPDNPFMCVARLINADSYYREGGYYKLAQATSEYRTWLELFPDDKIVPQVMLKMAEVYVRLSRLRNGTGYGYAEKLLQDLQTRFPEFESEQVWDYLDFVQESLADHNLRVARFYYDQRSSLMAAGMRCAEIVDKQPRFTKIDEALWCLALAEEADEDSESAIAHYGRIVRDHPASVYRNLAENRLRYYNRPVPESNPRVGAEISERSARIARVLADFQGIHAKPLGRAILLNEWDQIDPALIYELIRGGSEPKPSSNLPEAV